MKVAIHQPNYLPWIGYFYKIYLANTFIFLDSVPYSKQGYTNRVQIKKNRYQDDYGWMTIPVKKRPLGTAIIDMEVDDSTDWFAAHEARLYNAYGKLENYDRVLGIIKYALDEANPTSLAEINKILVLHIANWLYVSTAFESSSILTEGKSTRYNIVELIKKVEGTSYISGTGAADYQEEEEYVAADIELQYANITTYLRSPEGQKQNPAGANIGASIIDWMMRYDNTHILNIFRSAKASLGSTTS